MKSARNMLPVCCMLAGGLLSASCCSGTCIGNIPYCVGMSKPVVRGSQGGLQNHPGMECDQEIYRIGSAYYSKVETLYCPMKSDGLTWKYVFPQDQHNSNQININQSV